MVSMVTNAGHGCSPGDAVSPWARGENPALNTSRMAYPLPQDWQILYV